MISKQVAKFVKSLKLKKYRTKASAFLVEGAKNVSELLASDFEIKHLFITDRFLHEYGKHLPNQSEYTLCSEKELINLGTFKSNQYALAVAHFRPIESYDQGQKIMLALDEVQDPGNLGTIIRIADWYGIKTIIASPGTADVYNPKVINSSMGSFTRVGVIYMALESFFSSLSSVSTVYGALLQGNNVHDIKPNFPAVVLMGSESTGIGKNLIPHINEKITIPRFGDAESLNVAISTAIICDNLLRN